MSKMIDLSGERFGRLVAQYPVKSKKGEKLKWYCVCDCGNNVLVLSNSLRTGNTKSCGCLSKTIQGGLKDRLYVVWQKMKDRCCRQYCERYKNYGARGIGICKDWMCYTNFKKWALKNGYNEKAKKWDCTLDRIDVNGDYCPENCRFIPMSEQGFNKTNTRYLLVDGEKMPLTKASQKYGVNVPAIWARISKLGWSDEDAVKTPIGGKRCHSHLEAG